jgi:hypothetical protein
MTNGNLRDCESVLRRGFPAPERPEYRWRRVSLSHSSQSATAPVAEGYLPGLQDV